MVEMLVIVRRCKEGDSPYHSFHEHSSGSKAVLVFNFTESHINQFDALLSSAEHTIAKIRETKYVSWIWRDTMPEIANVFYCKTIVRYPRLMHACKCEDCINLITRKTEIACAYVLATMGTFARPAAPRPATKNTNRTSKDTTYRPSPYRPSRVVKSLDDLNIRRPPLESRPPIQSRHFQTTNEYKLAHGQEILEVQL